jgi:hypothetical protein
MRRSSPPVNANNLPAICHLESICRTTARTIRCCRDIDLNDRITLFAAVEGTTARPAASGRQASRGITPVETSYTPRRNDRAGRDQWASIARPRPPQNRLYPPSRLRRSHRFAARPRSRQRGCGAARRSSRTSVGHAPLPSSYTCGDELHPAQPDRLRRGDVRQTGGTSSPSGSNEFG